jgi:hypothetical protein
MDGAWYNWRPWTPVREFTRLMAQQQAAQQKVIAGAAVAQREAIAAWLKACEPAAPLRARALAPVGEMQVRQWHELKVLKALF